MNKPLLTCLCFLLSIMLCSKTESQSNTMYYNAGIPQAYYLNPATQPRCNVFIGAPVLSSFYVNFYNSAFSINDLFWKDSETDSIYYLFDERADPDKFADLFKKSNIFSAEMAVNLASFGFRVREMYFTFDITSRNSGKIIYPKDLILFLNEGNYDGQVLDMSGLGIEFLSYNEFALGISRNFGNQWSVGIRPKLLIGNAALTTSNTDITVNTGLREWPVVAKSELHICTPGFIIPTDADGIIDLDQEFEFDSTIDESSEYRKLALGNKGFGIDLGAHFRPVEELEFSLSLLDLGFIKWKNYTHSVILDGEYDYEGYVLNSADTIDYSDYIMDTLQESFRLTGSDASFKTTLTSKLFIGARYFLTPSFDVGLLAHMQLKKYQVDPDILLMANWRPSAIWTLSLSYGLLSGSYTSFGLGTSFRLGPFNLYFVSDNIPTRYNVYKTEDFDAPLPNDLHSYNFRFGLNLVFGCNRIKKLLEDEPMYYSFEY